MKRALLFAAAASLAASLAFAAADVPPDGKIDTWKEKSTKGPVFFPHSKHAKVECKACHHTWDGKAKMQKCSDAACHPDLVEKKGEKSLYNAYHNMTSTHSCIGCHKAAKKDNKPTGPINCNDCHPPKQ